MYNYFKYMWYVMMIICITEDWCAQKAAHKWITDGWFMDWNTFSGKEMFKGIAFK